MSLQDKEQYLHETKELIKEGINNLGQELTNESTFRSYTTGLNNIYNDLPKISATGATISLSPTRKGKLEIQLKGNTGQSVPPSPTSPQTVHVVTGNNTITIGSTGYSINLGNIELCKIGDYQDYIYKENNNWYKYKIIGKVTLNGSENYGYSQQTNNVFYTGTSISDINLEYNKPFSNYYRGEENVHSASQASAKGNNTICCKDYDSQIYIIDNRFSNKDDLKEWLQSHNLLIYYVLNNPIIEQIADTTLIAQLEAIGNAMSVTGTTSISQTNADLPFIINASALRGNPTGSINITQSGNTDVTNYATAVLTTEQKTVKSTTSSQTITPTTGKFIDGITVEAIDNTIDSNIVPQNIKKDVSILGITGTYEGVKAIFPDKIKFGQVASEVTNMDWLLDIDTSNVTDASYMFYNLSNLTSIPAFDTSNVTNFLSFCEYCSGLSSMPLLDTSKGTLFSSAFRGCSFETLPAFDLSKAQKINYLCVNNGSLKNVPVYDWSSIIMASPESIAGLFHTFDSCYNLTNESLNNIMASCITATNYNPYPQFKTLKHIGLSSTQATTCQSLSNWNDFVAAGWSSGY